MDFSNLNFDVLLFIFCFILAELFITFNFNFCSKHWLKSFKTICLFDSNLWTTAPFLTAYLEIFYCTHHPVIPNSNLYFTFSSTLNALYKRWNIIFPRGRGGTRLGKNCLHEKNCWNKLSAPEVHLKKIVCRGHPCYGKFGEFWKSCLHSEWRKNL